MFTPEHLKEICPRCMQPHSKNWKPQFSRQTHYRTLTCEHCDYKIFFATPEFNSGHY